MSCFRCKKGVYERVGFIYIQDSGTVKFKKSLFELRDFEDGVFVEVCSFCADIKLQGTERFLPKIKKECRELLYSASI